MEWIECHSLNDGWVMKLRLHVSIQSILFLFYLIEVSEEWMRDGRAHNPFQSLIEFILHINQLMEWRPAAIESIADIRECIHSFAALWFNQLLWYQFIQTNNSWVMAMP